MKNLVIASVCLGLSMAGASAQDGRLSALAVSRSVEVNGAGQQPDAATMTVDETGQVTINFKKAHNFNNYNTSTMKLSRGELKELQTLLEKSVKWQKIAIDNKVERFEKPIGTLGGQEILFSYADPEFPAQLRGGMMTIDTRQAAQVLEVLSQIESMDEELSKMVQKRDKEAALFN